jgi:cytidine deaminase
MLDLLREAQSFARPALTNLRVGAVVRGVSGALYVGANIEFAGANLGQTVHAEQAALSNAFMRGETGIEAVAVSAPPCGHCRQFLYEFAQDRDMEILLPEQPAITTGDFADAFRRPRVDPDRRVQPTAPVNRTRQFN